MIDNKRKLLLDRHRAGIPGIFKIFQAKRRIYLDSYFLLSILISGALICLSSFSKITSYILLLQIVDYSLTIIPSLLGFNLGAYILVVGFSSGEILKDFANPIKEFNDFSYYQILNSIFGLSLLVQAFTLIAAFLIKFTASLHIRYFWNKFNVQFSTIEVVFNNIALTSILFLFIYSMLLLINIVQQIFEFSQSIHFFLHDSKK